MMQYKLQSVVNARPYRFLLYRLYTPAEPGRLKILSSRLFACFIKFAENLHDNSTDYLYSVTSLVTSRLRDEINVRPLFVKNGIPKLAKSFRFRKIEMADEASIIVFSPLYVDLVEEDFFIKAEDIDGRLWTLVGPISDNEVAASFRAAQSALEDGWGYLITLRSKLSGPEC